MSEKKIGVDYSILHQLDSPANRLLRESIWGRENDFGQQSFITPVYLDEIIHRLGINESSYVLDVGSGAGGPAIYIASKTGCRIAGVDVSDVGVVRPAAKASATLTFSMAVCQAELATLTAGVAGSVARGAAMIESDRTV